MSNDRKKTETQDRRAPTGGGDGPALPGRRRLLKGAGAAVPVMMTLQSGAAFARTSNLISETDDATPEHGNSFVRCLETGGPPPPPGTKMDLGEVGPIDIQNIENYAYYSDNQCNNPVSLRDVCNNRGSPYFIDPNNNTNCVQATPAVNQGILVSSAALTSVAGRLSVTETNFPDNL